jgi:hypothetical protein
VVVDLEAAFGGGGQILAVGAERLVSAGVVVDWPWFRWMAEQIESVVVGGRWGISVSGV